jgi:hypothetical protein
LQETDQLFRSPHGRIHPVLTHERGDMRDHEEDPDVASEIRAKRGSPKLIRGLLRFAAQAA